MGTTSQPFYKDPAVFRLSIVRSCIALLLVAELFSSAAMARTFGRFVPLSSVSVGTVVWMTLPKFACPSQSDFKRTVELTLQSDTDGLQKLSNASGCRQFARNTPAEIKLWNAGQKMICIRPYDEEIELECLWTSPSDLLEWN
jgi:hypothetical protein